HPCRALVHALWRVPVIMIIVPIVMIIVVLVTETKVEIALGMSRRQVRRDLPFLMEHSPDARILAVSESNHSWNSYGSAVEGLTVITQGSSIRFPSLATSARLHATPGIDDDGVPGTKADLVVCLMCLPYFRSIYSPQLDLSIGSFRIRQQVDNVKGFIRLGDSTCSWHFN